MHRLDIARLRKDRGISQRQLADMLQIRQSFLSAIENGKSRLPEEKLERVKELFNPVNLDEYIIDDRQRPASLLQPTGIQNEGDILTQLLKHFHDLAHKADGTDHEVIAGRIETLEERNDFLSRRNDMLSERVDSLREEVDLLREENLRLKELLTLNSIKY